MGFKWNGDGMEQFKRNLEKQFSGKGIQVPLDGAEDDAVRSVVEQLTNMGLTPNEAEVEQYVRDARTTDGA